MSDQKNLTFRVPTKTVDAATNSVASKIITNALVQVEMTLKKVEEALFAINNQLQTISNQKIGLTAQKAMLAELRRVIEEAEYKENATSQKTAPVEEVIEAQTHE